MEWMKKHGISFLLSDAAGGQAGPAADRQRLDQPAINRQRLIAEKLIVFYKLEQLSASYWTRVALCVRQ
jgi:hypothetical protein